MSSRANSPPGAPNAEARTEPITIDAKAKDGHNLESVQTTAGADAEYPTGLRLALILISAFMSMFLVSLVNASTPSDSSKPSN